MSSRGLFRLKHPLATDCREVLRAIDFGRVHEWLAVSSSRFCSAAMKTRPKYERRDPAKLAVTIDGGSSSVRRKAEKLADTLSASFAAPTDDTHQFLLTFTDARLELRFPLEPRSKPLFVDFHELFRAQRRSRHPARLLFKAIDPVGSRPSVVDATAGLARDAFLLADYGCKVLAIERSPILSALIDDGVRRARQDEQLAAIFDERLTIVQGDAMHLLNEPLGPSSPDVVYLDPMFPPKRKNSLVKKEMRVLRDLVGDDQDATELLQIAIDSAARHVTVKRMRHAPPIQASPLRVYMGKTTRYDVYGACGPKEKKP